MTKDFYGAHKEHIDYQINKYTIKCLKILLLVLTILWLMNLIGIFIVDKKIMTISYLCSSIVLITALIYGHFIDLKQPHVKYVLTTMTILTAIILGVTLTYHTLLLSVIPLMLATQYPNKKVLIYTFILTVISNFVIVIGGYFFGLCDANMVFLTTEKTSYYLSKLDNNIALKRNDNPWYSLILFFAIPRSIIHALMLPFIYGITQNIIKTNKHALEMKRLSEIDEMTGLYNRNKLLSMIDNYYIELKTISVIYFDVNNLKDINDNLGHDKGDILIETVGKILKNLTDDFKKAYRLGGDEFIIIIENPMENEIKNLLKKWEELLLIQSKETGLEIIAAVGYSSGEGKDINNIIKNADEIMYQNKKEQKKIV